MSGQMENLASASPDLHATSLGPWLSPATMRAASRLLWYHARGDGPPTYVHVSTCSTKAPCQHEENVKVVW